MTDCVYFFLYLALGKLSLMLLINYYYYNIFHNAAAGLKLISKFILNLTMSTVSEHPPDP